MYAGGQRPAAHALSQTARRTTLRVTRPSPAMGFLGINRWPDGTGDKLDGAQRETPVVRAVSVEPHVARAACRPGCARRCESGRRSRRATRAYDLPDCIRCQEQRAVLFRSVPRVHCVARSLSLTCPRPRTVENPRGTLPAASPLVAIPATWPARITPRTSLATVIEWSRKWD